jgi:hypothetical protein
MFKWCEFFFMNCLLVRLICILCCRNRKNICLFHLFFEIIFYSFFILEFMKGDLNQVLRQFYYFDESFMFYRVKNNFFLMNEWWWDGELFFFNGIFLVFFIKGLDWNYVMMIFWLSILVLLRVVSNSFFMCGGKLNFIYVI